MGKNKGLPAASPACSLFWPCLKLLWRWPEKKEKEPEDNQKLQKQWQ